MESDLGGNAPLQLELPHRAPILHLAHVPVRAAYHVAIELVAVVGAGGLLEASREHLRHGAPILQREGDKQNCSHTGTWRTSAGDRGSERER